MATKLKNLAVTSVDLVDQGANPDAHIQLFKRADPEPGKEPDKPDEGQDGNTEGEPEGSPAGEPEGSRKKNPEEPTETEKGLFRKFFHWIMKGGGQDGAAQEPDGGIQKGAKLFAETKDKAERRQQCGMVFDCCYALSDSLASIIEDDDLTPDGRKAMAEQSIKEFCEAIAPVWDGAGGQQAADGIQKSAEMEQARLAFLAKRGLAENTNHEKEEYDTMRIDKSKMTPEEAAVLEGFEKKYGTADEPEGSNAPAQDGGVKKGGEGNAPQPEDAPALNPEVAKAISDMNAAYEAQTKQLQELQKSLETERMNAVAKKYEPLGKKTDELAAKLYDLKKAGGTVYDDYVALLDENLAMVGKSGLFGEIGSNREGSAGSAESIGIKAAELAKSANGSMTQAEAVIKAFEENPDLAAQYEQEYMRG